MEFNLKRILGITYLVAGFVWCILNLPNLMAKAKGNAMLATGLTVLRVLFWPVFAVLVFKSKGVALGEGAPDEEATESAD